VTSLGYARGSYFATAATVSGSALFACQDGVGWAARTVPNLSVTERLAVVSGRGETLVRRAVSEAGARLWRSDRPGRWEETAPPPGFEPAADAGSPAARSSSPATWPLSGPARHDPHLPGAVS
jgi:hypothetical protein